MSRSIHLSGSEADMLSARARFQRGDSCGPLSREGRDFFYPYWISIVFFPHIALFSAHRDSLSRVA